MLSSLLQPYLRREAAQPYSGEPLLFTLLLHPDFGNDPVDIALLLLHRRSAAGRKGVESIPLLSLLENPLLLYSLGLSRVENLMLTANLLQEWTGKTRKGEEIIPEKLPLAALRTREVQNPHSGPVTIALPDEKYFKNFLRQMSLSVSTLNKFLRCPLQFYYENILKVVSGEPVQFTFGKVMHTVLEKALIQRKETGNWPSEDEILLVFEEEMVPSKAAMSGEIYTGYDARGKAILRRYYAEMIPLVHTNAAIEYSVPRVLLDRKIPLTGRIDKLEFYPDGAKVVDYKTGNPESAFRKAGRPSEENILGGDYWRQMVFYKILVEAETGQHGLVKTGAVEFLEREVGKNVREEFPLTEEDGHMVRGQVKEAWKKIQSGQFQTGCGREHCEWCSLARENGLGL